MREFQKRGWNALETVGRLYDNFSVAARIVVSHPARLWCPPVDVFECDDLYVIKLSISGLRKSADGEIIDANVTAEGNAITIRGRRDDDSCYKKCSFYQMEIYYGPFECQVKIDAPFDAERIEAQYRDGFLEIVVPKKKAAQPDTTRVAVH